MAMVSTEEAFQYLLDEITALRVAVLGLAQALSRSGAMDLDTFADKLLALRLTGETEGAVKARADLAEIVRAYGPSSPPTLRVVRDNDNEGDE